MLLVIVKLAWIAVTAFEMPGNFTDRKEHYVIKTDAQRLMQHAVNDKKKCLIGTSAFHDSRLNDE